MKELYKALQELNIPVAYRKFNKPTNLPYIVYYITSNSDVYADNTNYVKRLNINIDLYTDYKDIDLETKVEDLLNNNKLVYSKEEYYIESENMYRIIFYIQLVAGFTRKDVEELPDILKYDIGINLVDEDIDIDKIKLDDLKEE